MSEIEALQGSRASEPKSGDVAGAEIMVTDEMIQAGKDEIASVWTDFVALDGESKWAEVVAAVYRAMAAKAPYHNRPRRPAINQPPLSEEFLKRCAERDAAFDAIPMPLLDATIRRLSQADGIVRADRSLTPQVSSIISWPPRD